MKLEKYLYKEHHLLDSILNNIIRTRTVVIIIAAHQSIIFIHTIIRLNYKNYSETLETIKRYMEITVSVTNSSHFN